MNYSTLFPNILKKMPDIKDKDLCYNYEKNNTLKLYMPSGKKMILWFIKHDNKLYSLLIDMEHNKRVYFKYIPFKCELTNGCGSIFWVTQIKNQLCLNKILYLYGNKYEKKRIIEHMNEIKYILDDKINYNSNTNLFMELKMPVMSNDKNYIYVACSLTYAVYNILTTNNYSISLKEYSAVFDIICLDYKKDNYKLYINDKEYCSAFVNDMKTSHFLKEIFKTPYKNYKKIELSDDENDENDENEENEKNNEINKRVLCVYIPNLCKWKPIKEVKYKNIDNIKRIKYIENKKYN
jgi:hypothetical protein